MQLLQIENESQIKVNLNNTSYYFSWKGFNKLGVELLDTLAGASVRLEIIVLQRNKEKTDKYYQRGTYTITISDENKCQNLDIAILYSHSYKIIVLLAREALRIPANTFKNDYYSLFLEEDSKDVTFVVSDQNFTAHKLILGARSPVFKKMFSTEMKETQTNTIEITDATPEVMKLFLEFIYGDKYEEGEFASELLYLAHKYYVPTLKAKAAFSLFSKVNKDNAMDILAQFDLYQMPEYKKETAYFVAKNKETVFPDEKKLELQKENRLLAEYINCIICTFGELGIV